MALDHLEDQIVVTCHCGRRMVPIIVSDDEILYACEDDQCHAQVNIMTTEKAATLMAMVPNDVR